MSNEQFAGQNSSFKQKFTKRRAIVTLLLVFGAYAAIQSVVSFGQTEDTIAEPLDKVVKQIEVKEETKHPAPPANVKTTDDGEIDLESYGLFGYTPPNDVPSAPPAPVVPAPPVVEDEEELALGDLTVEDCIEANISLAIVPDDLDDAIVEQCLILLEDLEDLLDDIEDEPATTTPTTTPRRSGGGGGSGGGDPEVVLSDDASLALFNVDIIDVLPLDGLEVLDFTETGAILTIDDHFCSEHELTPEPCFTKQNGILAGLFIESSDDKIDNLRVTIERNSGQSTWSSAIKVWENAEVTDLVDFGVMVGDIITVEVMAEDKATDKFFKLTIAEALSGNANLSLFNIGTTPVLDWPNIEVKDMTQLGAIANICPENINGELHPYFDCITSLEGIYLDTEDESVSNITISIYHDNPISKAVFVKEKFAFFEGDEELKQLENYQLVQDDMIFVQVVAEDGATIKNYKIQVVEGNYTDNVSLAAFTVGDINALDLSNIDISGWYDQGALIELCGPSHVAADCLADSEGIIVQTEEEVMYKGVYIERAGESLIWVNEQIDELVDFEVLPNDIIRVVVVASNGRALGFYKVSIVEEIRDDILLSEFTIDEHNALALPNVKINNLFDAGATLFVKPEQIVPCLAANSGECTTLDLTGIYAAHVLEDVEATVYTYRSYWVPWVGEEGIAALADHELAIGDMVVVLLKDEDGIQQTLYKATITESPTEPIIVKKIYPSKHIGGGGSVAPVKEKPLKETDFSNIQDQEIKKEETVDSVEVEKTEKVPESQPEDTKIVKEPVVVKEKIEIEVFPVEDIVE
jgi:hypothetical protein